MEITFSAVIPEHINDYWAWIIVLKHFSIRVTLLKYIYFLNFNPSTSTQKSFGHLVVHMQQRNYLAPPKNKISTEEMKGYRWWTCHCTIKMGQKHGKLTHDNSKSVIFLRFTINVFQLLLLRKGWREHIGQFGVYPSLDLTDFFTTLLASIMFLHFFHERWDSRNISFNQRWHT